MIKLFYKTEVNFNKEIHSNNVILYNRIKIK